MEVTLHKYIYIKYIINCLSLLYMRNNYGKYLSINMSLFISLSREFLSPLLLFDHVDLSLMEVCFPPSFCFRMMPNLTSRVQSREFGKLDNVIRELSLVGNSHLFCLISLIPCPLYISHLYIVSELLVLI